MGESIKLNLGAGNTVIDGWTAIDRKLGTEVYPLPQYADNSVDEIRASHVLEHLSFGEAHLALAEWHRVLKPGGRIRIAVPDIDLILATDDPKKLHFLMGGQLDENDFHRSAYDAKTLAFYLDSAGFENFEPWTGDGVDMASHGISLNMTATKKLPQPQPVKISALMSVPRVGWNDAETCISRALSEFGIPTCRVTGVFWGQCMQRGMRKAVEKGTDWLLTIDYDSMFTGAMLQQLINDFASTPEADAMCALQRRRASDQPLVTKAGVNGKVTVDGTPIEVNTGHFGLTLLRVASIAKMPKPWFWEAPDANGEWDDGRTDADIFFWRQWKAAGNTLYMAPAVSIGHLELVVSEFDENMQPRQLHVSDWRKKEGLDK